MPTERTIQDLQERLKHFAHALSIECEHVGKAHIALILDAASALDAAAIKVAAMQDERDEIRLSNGEVHNKLSAAEAKAKANRLGKVTSFTVGGETYLCDPDDGVLGWRERLAAAEARVAELEKEVLSRTSIEEHAAMDHSAFYEAQEKLRAAEARLVNADLLAEAVEALLLGSAPKVVPPPDRIAEALTALAAYRTSGQGER